MSVQNISLQVSEEDVGSVDFIVFQRPNTIGITGNILTDPEHLTALKVQCILIECIIDQKVGIIQVVLYRQDESVTAAVSPDMAGFFELSLPTSALSKVQCILLTALLSQLQPIGLHHSY